MEEETHYQAIEPTKPVMNPYEFIPIPPPPPHARKRKTWQIVLIVGLAVLLSGSGVIYLLVSSHQEQVQAQAHHDATSTANTRATGTAIIENTSIAATHMAMNATATQSGIQSTMTQQRIEATTTQRKIDATVTASIPTPVPIPTQAPLYTAQDLYDAFTMAGIGMADEGTMSSSQWTCCTYHPGRGGVQFTDVSSGGGMIAALFNGTSATQIDQQQAHDAWGWGYYSQGTCLLLYQSSSTNLTPYEQVMNQYCS